MAADPDAADDRTGTAFENQRPVAVQTDDRVTVLEEAVILQVEVPFAGRIPAQYQKREILQRRSPSDDSNVGHLQGRLSTYAHVRRVPEDDAAEIGHLCAGRRT